MSDSASSRSKSLTESSDTESTINPLLNDRWSNNICYRQLVISSCIGIVQLWWHPYVHDLQKLLPFLFLYNVFSIFVGYPLFYLELALGVVTRKGVVSSWDLAPIARGVGIAMLGISVFTALVSSTVAAWCLAMLVHSFHSFLPWLHCAATAQPPCAARHRPLTNESEIPPQSFFFNFVLNLKRDDMDGGLGTLVRDLSIYYVICWILVYLIAVKRIYSISKLVLFKDVLAYFVLVCCAVGAARLNGATTMLYACDWSALFYDYKMWGEAVEYALIEMTVSQGSLIMLGAYCPKEKHTLARTCLLAFAASKSSSILSALTLGAVHGALQKDYDNSTNVWKGGSASIILWSDFVARVPGSQFWSMLLFFTLFVLALSTTALLVQTVMSSLTGRSVRKIAWALLIITAALFALIGVMTTGTQSGLYIVNFLMRWPVVKPRVAVAAALALTVTYVYTQSIFCEDVYFAVGEYPCMFLRVCWALAPPPLVVMFVSLGLWPASGDIFGWALVHFTVLPIVVVIIIYSCFKFRIRNIVTEK